VIHFLSLVGLDEKVLSQLPSELSAACASASASRGR
jgi:hypothetical protein